MPKQEGDLNSPFMRVSNVRYWICQILGWGGWSLLNIFFVYLFAQDYYFAGERRKFFFAVLIIEFIWYIISTHLLRFSLKRMHWMAFPTNKVIILFVIGVTITGLLSYYGARTTARATGYSLAVYEQQQDLLKAREFEESRGLLGTDYYIHPPVTAADSAIQRKAQRIRERTGWYRDSSGEWIHEDRRSGRFWWDLIFNFILVALWLLLYMIWHYLLRNQKAEVDKISLEKTVKELEIKTIKSHINPHFIFNSLNSIRALVDENPGRARTAITELSNILRSSLQVEKMETVTLEKELSIVKDFLALEQMRFEERLQINFNIDEETLNQPIPPMMLQTLVENAIKHGISKRINGGVVNIIARHHQDKFELLVQNTGRLEEEVAGFGIKSTRDRLQFLYGGNTTFELSNLDEDKVQARIVMPITGNGR